MIVPRVDAQAGSRLAVKYRGADLWHERVVLEVITPGELYILTPDGDQYAEELGDYSNWLDITGMARYPVQITEIHAFNDVLDDAELRDRIVEARRQVVVEQRRRGIPELVSDSALNWTGHALALPVFRPRVEALRRQVTTPGAVVRRRLTQKQALPLVDAGHRVDDNVSGHVGRAGDIAIPRDNERVPTAVEEPPPGKVWVVTDLCVVGLSRGSLTFGAEVTIQGRLSGLWNYQWWGARSLSSYAV